MKATVVHDETGEIIAIAKRVDLNEAGSKFTEAGIVPKQGEYALEVELTGELASTRLRDIHQHFRVDRAASKLVKRRNAVTE
jgi:hypothetical protein